MFIDLHSHVIPGVDDGSPDFEFSVKMLEMADSQGTTHIVATPHYFSGLTNLDVNTIQQHCDSLNNIMSEKGLIIRVLPGMEVYLNPDIHERYTHGEICTLNRTSYMLVELPFNSYPLYLEEELYRLQLSGVFPIIAHPERNANIFKNHTAVEDFVDKGILFQVNSGSITGVFGRTVQKSALMMIKKGFVHFVSSDAHTCGRRSPILQSAANIVEKHFGRQMMQALFFENAERYLLS